jgi:hypothetical protein
MITAISPAELIRASRVEALVSRKLEESRLEAAAGKKRVEDLNARELAARDAEVRAHEGGHLAALGAEAQGGIAYTYANGPGGAYAVGGSIKVDLSPVPGDPEATIRKAERIRAASLAPASPSAADFRVAALAYALEAGARAEQATEGPRRGAKEDAEPAAAPSIDAYA